ncbi:MAG: phage holin family protein [bacterium]|nr:phage holin family protein [bacterium]
MRLIGLFIFGVMSNIVAFLTANYFLAPNFIISLDFVDLIIAGSIFAVLNMIIRPIVKLILGPIIFLTLGLGIILVNALMLRLLDILYGGITIQDTITLIYATLIVTAVNLVIYLAHRSITKEE